MMLPVLGIVAGNGDLPLEIFHLYRLQGGVCYTACIDAAVYNHYQVQGITASKCFSLGAVGGIIEYFTQNKVTNVVIVGGITRPDFASIKVDFSGSILIAKILRNKFLGDDNVLRIVCEYIESKGFKVISAKEILESHRLQMTVRNIEPIKPSEHDISDIEIGKKLISTLGFADVGQSVVVCDGYVLGVEAAEGTDDLIKRCALLRRKNAGGVLVKMSKQGQDMRLDTPVVGSKTVMLLAQSKFNGLAIEQKGVIIVDQDRTFALLAKHNLFLHLI